MYPTCHPFSAAITRLGDGTKMLLPNWLPLVHASGEQRYLRVQMRSATTHCAMRPLKMILRSFIMLLIHKKRLLPPLFLG